MTTDFSKALPRPWYVAEWPSGAKTAIAHGDGIGVAEAETAFGLDVAEANAALIVAAVNAYGAGRADAVAWQCRDIGVADWGPAYETGEQLTDADLARYKMEQRPLYAHPPAASARIAELCQEIQKVLRYVERAATLGDQEIRSIEAVRSIGALVDAALAGGRA